MTAAASETVAGLAGAVRRRELSAVDAVRRSLERIESLDGELNCFRETCPEAALSRAEAIDRTLEEGGPAGPLAGVPVAVKDNLATDFGRTCCGSRILEAFESPYTATAVQRLLDAGAVVLGKTNCDEFAMGSSGENCAYGATRNPWDPSRVPGGSSSGSAAAVAAGMCPGALGSETGGSIRQPAALCGVVGAKPSYGRVSRHGLVAFGSSLDQVGPIARSVRDAAVLLRAVAGADPRDSTCAALDVPDYERRLDEPLPAPRIGVPRQYLGDDDDPAVGEAVRAAVDVYRDLGAEIVDLDLPLTDRAIATYYVIAPAEASSNLARYDGIRYGRRAAAVEGEQLFDVYARSRAEGFGPEVRRRIMLGTFVLSAGYYEAYYGRALSVRRLIRREYDAAFERCDALIGPTSPVPAFELGARADPLSMYLCDVYTVGAAIAGLCAISVPCGFADAGGRALPVGLQIQCPPFAEETMFRVARMFESATEYHVRRP